MGKKSYTRWLFVLPAIVIVIALFIYPICSSIVYSFTNKNLIKGQRLLAFIFQFPVMDGPVLGGTDSSGFYRCPGPEAD